MAGNLGAIKLSFGGKGYFGKSKMLTFEGGGGLILSTLFLPVKTIEKVFF